MGSGTKDTDRSSSFRFVYVGILAFVLLSVGTILGTRALLEAHFESAVARAIRVRPDDGPIEYQVQNRVYGATEASAWVRYGGARARAFVLGADGSSLYSVGRIALPPPLSDLGAPYREAARLLPATADVYVDLPLESLLASGIIVFYGSILTAVLFAQSRRAARRERQRIDRAVAERDETARRAGEIERELEGVRARLSAVEPSERAHAEEIRTLQTERRGLQAKLEALGEREAELRAKASRSSELDDERHALEQLLDEAVEDLGHKETEIQRLQESLKRAARAPAAGGRTRAVEATGRRLRTLYRELEIDDRAIQDLVALRDESMKLRAEEGIKRLCDGSELAAVRRKVGGLPPQLAIFELGFAGKGRIYYTRGESRRHRVLAIGAKNSQKADLEYLSRLA